VIKRYLVFDIGCIECLQKSQPVGTYDTIEEAKKARDEYYNGGTDWGRTGWFGQHSVKIYDLENIKINDDQWEDSACD